MEKRINIKACKKDAYTGYHENRWGDATDSRYFGQTVATWEACKNFVHLNIDGQVIKFSHKISGNCFFDGMYETDSLDVIEYILKRGENETSTCFSVLHGNGLEEFNSSVGMSIELHENPHNVVPTNQKLTSFADVLRLINKNELNQSEMLMLAQNLAYMQSCLELYPNCAYRVENLDENITELSSTPQYKEAKLQREKEEAQEKVNAAKKTHQPSSTKQKPKDEPKVPAKDELKEYYSGSSWVARLANQSKLMFNRLLGRDSRK